MTREELKEHCLKQIENCEMWARCKGEEPHGKVYEEHKLILELLEQETVSKEDYDHEYFLRKEFEIKIDKLQRQLDEQALEQEPRWIPVSERLPENKETVLVTFKHFVSGNTIGLGSVILLRDKPHWHVREQNLGTYDVLAWMPLPTSYERGEET